MADNVNPGMSEEHESQESGLFLSSDPVEGAGAPPLYAAGDTDKSDADTDASDVDEGDGGGGAEKGDLLGADTDSSADTDGTDSPRATAPQNGDGDGEDDS